MLLRSLLLLLTLGTAIPVQAISYSAESTVFDLSDDHLVTYFRGQSNVFSLSTPANIAPALWQKVSLGTETYSIYLILRSGTELETGRALSRNLDQSHLLRIEVRDASDHPVDLVTATKAVALVQSAILSLTRSPGLGVAADFEPVIREDYANQSYTIYPLSAWTGLWRVMNVYTGTFLPGTDHASSRRAFLRDAILELALQANEGAGLEHEDSLDESVWSLSEILFSGALDEADLPSLSGTTLNLMQRATGRIQGQLTAEEALEGLSGLTSTLSFLAARAAEGKISASTRIFLEKKMGGHYATKLQKWAGHTAKIAGGFSAALSVYSLRSKFDSSVTRLNLLHAAASERASQRLQLIRTLSANWAFDPEWESACDAAEGKLTELQSGYYDNLGAVLIETAKQGAVVDVAGFGYSMVVIFGQQALVKSVGKFLLPWYLSWEVAGLIRDQETAGQDSAAMATLAAMLDGTEGPYRLAVELEDDLGRRGVWDGDKISQLLEAQQLQFHARSFAYRRALDSAANKITSLGFLNDAAYKAYIDGLTQAHRNARLAAQRLQDLPYLADFVEPFQSTDGGGEFAWLLSLLSTPADFQETAVAVDFSVELQPLESGAVTVKLVNRSLGAAELNWDLGEFGQTNSQDTPSFTVTRSGTYAVRLAIFDLAGREHSLTKQITVATSAPALAADFSAQAGTATSTHQDYQFSDASTGNISARWWDFGDGSGSSEANPTHRFYGSGIYPVSLTVYAGSFSSTKKFALSVNLPEPHGSLSLHTNLSSAVFEVTGKKAFIGTGTSFSKSDLPAGTYTINFGKILGYAAPATQDFSITAGQTTSLNVVYQSVGNPPLITSHPGSITVGLARSATLGVSFIPYDGSVRIEWYKNGNLIPGVTTALYTIPAVDFSDTGNYEVRLYNDAALEGVASRTARLTVVTTPPSDYSYWRDGRFLPTELADARISGPHADPDGDTLPNLLEYALGLDPRASQSSNLPQIGTTATDWIYHYTRPADRIDLSYVVEISTDLVHWTSAGLIHDRISAGSTETWQVRVPRSGNAQLFFRLTVTMQP